MESPYAYQITNEDCHGCHRSRYDDVQSIPKIIPPKKKQTNKHTNKVKSLTLIKLKNGKINHFACENVNV